MADPVSKTGLSSTKPPSSDNAGPIIEESQESEEYQQDLQVVLGTAFGVIAIVGLIALGLLLYRLYRVRSGSLSYNQNDDLNLFERDLGLDVANKSEGYPSQPTVLMLYAQDCPIHERMVAALASFLMEACGCVVSLDLLEEAEIAQRGLDDWLIERLQEADFILTVCSLGARLRCSKKHLRFQKWSTQISKGGRDGMAGDESLSSSPTLKKVKDQRIKEVDGQGDRQSQDGPGEGDSKGKSERDKDNLITSLSGAITDYFAVAVDYVAEKMRVEQQKGLGLDKFLNVYFDYSARSDIPPQLEMAAQYCLLRNMKQLRQHLIGTSHPNTYLNQVNEREEGITIVGDGSEKSDEGEGSHSGFPCQPCDMLETETGMLLRATLEQAKAFFQDNPTWMEEQMEQACPPPPPQLQASHSAGFFKGGRGKRWRRRRHHYYGQDVDGRSRKEKVSGGRGSVKEPLLSHHSRGEVDGSLISAPSSLLSPMTLQQKLAASGLGFPTEDSRDRLQGDVGQQLVHWASQNGRPHQELTGAGMCNGNYRTRNTLPRLGKVTDSMTQLASEGSEGRVSNERMLGLGMDSPVPQGIFLSRQNSLPSSLASSRTPEVSCVIDTDRPTSAVPSPSLLQPAAKLSCMSRSADSFVLNRDLREWHPMDHERTSCLYCNGTQLDRGCTRCRPGHLGNLKGAPDQDIDPGFSSSTEGVPVLLHHSYKNTSKSQTTVLQAEVHQDWRAGQDSSRHPPDPSSSDGPRGWNSDVDLPAADAVSAHQSYPGQAPVQSQLSLHGSQPVSASLVDGHGRPRWAALASQTHRDKVSEEDSPGMRRWVSGIVRSPKHWLTTDDHNYSNSINQPPASFQYQHRHYRTLSGTSSLASQEDSASVSSSDSVSDGDSLERDLRSIQKISSFHDFVISSSFVDSQGMTFACAGSISPSQPPLTLLANVPFSSSQHPENA